MKMKGISIGALLMNLAVACYLFATGIMGFAEKSIKTALNKPEIRQAVEGVFTGRDFKDLNEVLIVIFSILAIAAGVCIVLKIFSVQIPMFDLVLIILAIVWLVFIILIDVIAPINSKKDFDLIDWLRIFSPHLMVLAGIALATDRFGCK
jgi:hypothetical protein